jgi:RsiW-degrading membrane proteinase PrsW (M82 family)
MSGISGAVNEHRHNDDDDDDDNIHNDATTTTNYHSFPQEEDAEGSATSHSIKYRGFDTSINDMFVDPEFERVDCCALACCGVFQSDRDRYLLTGYKPPSTGKRCFMHIIFPISLFISACLCAVKIRDPVRNAVMSCGFLFTMIAWFIVQCFKGTWKRRDMRKELLWTKYQLITTGEILHQRSEDSSLLEDRAEEEPDYYLGQTRGDIRRAHAPCSCYVRDTPLNNQDDDATSNKASICTNFFRCFTNICCGVCCGMHFQLCGMCGLAQEARQIEKLLPVAHRRADYITMEPFTNYYARIYQARYPETDGISSIPWWNQLSKLSLRIIGTSIFFLGLLFIWSLLAKRMGHPFGPISFLLLCATFLQAFLFLYIVYAYSSRDLSLDALIKFFASGFLLTASFAVFFELAVGLTIRVTMSIIMAMSGIDVVDDNSYGGTMFQALPGFGKVWLSAGMDTSSFNDNGTSDYRDYLHVYGREHPFVYTVYLLITAFFLAATVEELSKYFGYRMVEHPDFLSRRQLEEAAECFDASEDEEEAAESQHHTHGFNQRNLTLESKGSMITVAMVAVSLGFATCENLIYVFVYTEASLGMQLLVLFARSIFPVHPIAAAMQSIRVCERDLERRKAILLGRIITPAVLFHGGYDFCLMWIQFIATKDGQYVDANDDGLESKDTSVLWSIAVALVFVLVGLRYYFRQSKGQTERLQSLDHDATQLNSSLI